MDGDRARMNRGQLPGAALKKPCLAKSPPGFFSHPARFRSTRDVFDSLAEMKLLESLSVSRGVMLYSREQRGTQLELREGSLCQKTGNSFS